MTQFSCNIRAPFSKYRQVRRFLETISFIFDRARIRHAVYAPKHRSHRDLICDKYTLENVELAVYNVLVSSRRTGRDRRRDNVSFQQSSRRIFRAAASESAIVRIVSADFRVSASQEHVVNVRVIALELEKKEGMINCAFVVRLFRLHRTRPSIDRERRSAPVVSSLPQSQ